MTTPVVLEESAQKKAKKIKDAQEKVAEIDELPEERKAAAKGKTTKLAVKNGLKVLLEMRKTESTQATVMQSWVNRMRVAISTDTTIPEETKREFYNRLGKYEAIAMASLEVSGKLEALLKSHFPGKKLDELTDEDLDAITVEDFNKIAKESCGLIQPYITKTSSSYLATLDPDEFVTFCKANGIEKVFKDTSDEQPGFPLEAQQLAIIPIQRPPRLELMSLDIMGHVATLRAIDSKNISDDTFNSVGKVVDTASALGASANAAQKKLETAREKAMKALFDPEDEKIASILFQQKIALPENIDLKEKRKIAKEIAKAVKTGQPGGIDKVLKKHGCTVTPPATGETVKQAFYYSQLNKDISELIRMSASGTSIGRTNSDVFSFLRLKAKFKTPGGSTTGYVINEINKEYDLALNYFSSTPPNFAEGNKSLERIKGHLLRIGFVRDAAINTTDREYNANLAIEKIREKLLSPPPVKQTPQAAPQQPTAPTAIAAGRPAVSLPPPETKTSRQAVPPLPPPRNPTPPSKTASVPVSPRTVPPPVSIAPTPPSRTAPQQLAKDKVPNLPLRTKGTAPPPLPTAPQRPTTSSPRTAPQQPATDKAPVPPPRKRTIPTGNPIIPPPPPATVHGQHWRTIDLSKPPTRKPPSPPKENEEKGDKKELRSLHR